MIFKGIRAGNKLFGEKSPEAWYMYDEKVTWNEEIPSSSDVGHTIKEFESGRYWRDPRPNEY